MRVYFNNNSFTWREPLKDSFSRAVRGCSCGEAKSRAQPRLRAQSSPAVPLGEGLALPCQYQPGHVLLSDPCHVLSSTFQWQWHLMQEFLIFLFSLTNYKLIPGYHQPKCAERYLCSSTSQLGIPNSPSSPWLSELWLSLDSSLIFSI